MSIIAGTAFYRCSATVVSQDDGSLRMASPVALQRTEQGNCIFKSFEPDLGMILARHAGLGQVFRVMLLLRKVLQLDIVQLLPLLLCLAPHFSTAVTPTNVAVI